MMASWLVSGWAFHFAATHPATGIVIQSQDEDRAVHDIDNMKVLWEHSIAPLRARWALSKPLGKQPFDQIELANRSWALGIPGDPDKIRSEHPTIVILDEAAIIVRGEESRNIAVATRCLKMVSLSSAMPGYFDDLWLQTTPADWPEYAEDTA